MTNEEIYEIAGELKDKEVDAIVRSWELSNDQALETYKSLLALGDSKQLACVTAISEKYKSKNNKADYQKLIN